MMGPLWTRLAAIPSLLVMTGLLFMWSVSHDAWSADVRAGLHDAYGRLVFDWGKPFGTVSRFPGHVPR